MLCEWFDEIDYNNAKEEVFDFIKDRSSLAIWTSVFFKGIKGELKKL